MNEQQKFWSETYAKNYIEKNSEFDVDQGVNAWGAMLQKANDVGSLLECGANIGRNIDFLNTLLPDAKKSAIELSPDAYEILTNRFEFDQTFNGAITKSSFGKNKFDLVFTIGVLIHIAPDDLLANMQKMFEYSNRYILIGEYFNRTPMMVEYQGEQNKLFKRDFGKMFIENHPVKLVDYGFLWGYLYDDSGFDDITWWLFEKQ